MDNLSLIVLPSTVATIDASAIYDCNYVRIGCEASSRPEGWDSSFVNNGYMGIYYNYDMNRELTEVTFTSADSSRAYDGSWWNPTGEITLTSGELAEGDTFSANYNNTYGDKGTYEARFNVTIYDSQMMEVTQYYIINKVCGTYTIN